MALYGYDNNGLVCVCVGLCVAAAFPLYIQFLCVISIGTILKIFLVVLVKILNSSYIP